MRKHTSCPFRLFLFFSLLTTLSFFIINAAFAQQITYQHPVGINNAPISGGNPVGTIKGEAGVSPDGSSTYNIPIFCPPGTNGMQPHMSINYSSGSGYGCLGWGWDIFGLSSISRVSKTFCEDGALGSPEMKGDDVFAIDGNRLIMVPNNTKIYESTYYTEMADFSIITSHGISGTGPQYFTVQLPNGTIKEYGNTCDSRKLTDANSTVGIWRLNKITDVNGNYIEFKYNNCGLILQVKYTGNATANLQPYNEIDFNYAGRPDYNVSYPYYSTTLNDVSLLDNIQVMCNNAVVKQYQFNYERGPADVYSLLNEIIESDGSGSHLNSTIISWNDKFTPGNGFEIKYYQQPLFGDTYTNGININFPNRGRWILEDPAGVHLRWEQDPFACVVTEPTSWFEMYGDFNGDGYMDFFKGSNVPGDINGNPARIYWEIKLYDHATNTFSSASISGDIASIQDTSKTLLQVVSADYEGDGKTELFLMIQNDGPGLPDPYYGVDSIDLVSYSLSGTDLVRKPYGMKNIYSRGLLDPNYNPTIPQINYMDLNGDGRQNEIVLSDAEYSYGQPNGFFVDGTLFYMHNLPVMSQDISYGGTKQIPDFYIDKKNRFFYTDVNGNGKADIMLNEGIEDINQNVIDQKYTFYEFNGSAFQQLFYFTTGRPVRDSIYLGDFNGDGKTDLLIKESNNFTNPWHLLLSEGNAFTPSNSTGTVSDLNTIDLHYPDQYQVLTGDYNGDGKTDICLFVWDDDSEEYEIYVYYSYGAGFTKMDYGALDQSFSIGENNNVLFYPASDMNGDGNDDIIINKHYWFGDAAGGFNTSICFINPGKKPLLVKSITNGFDQTTSFDYKPLTNDTIYTVDNNTDPRLLSYRGPKYAVANMVQPDGIGGQDTTNFKYEGGLFHKYGKGFLGFTKVTAENIVTNLKTVSHYVLNPDFLMMNPDWTNTYISGSQVSLTQNTYGCYALSGPNGHGYYKQIFPYTVSGTTTDMLTNSVKKEEYNYGSNASDVLNIQGNLLSATETWGPPGNPETTKVTENSYLSTPYNTFNGTLNLLEPVQTTVTQTSGINPPFTKTTTYSYYTNGRHENTVEFPGLANEITTHLEYKDPQGNENPFGIVSKKTTSSPGIADRFMQYGYDAKGRFITSETDMLGRQQGFTYNETFGLKTSETNIANNTTTYVYDGFGNLTQQTLPNQVQNNYSLSWATPGSGVLNACYIKHAHLPNAPDVYIYYDAQGRELQSRYDGFSGLVATDKLYNAKGQIIQQTKPYYLADGPAEYVNTTYYPEERVLDITDIAGSDNAVTHYEYNGKTVTVTDFAGRQSSKTVNDAGQVVNSMDQGGTIAYTYYSNGQVNEITTNGATIKHIYDDYGRLISTNDPNTGTTTYSYNNFNQPLTQSDPTGTYTMTYDITGQLTKKTGPEGDYIYTYVPAGTNGVGLPLQITGPNGYSQQFTYNQYGQVLTKNEMIDGSSYNYSYAYDNFGNQASITYPNNFQVINVYNTHGKLISVKRADNNKQLWQLQSEDAEARPYTIQQGNNLITNYHFDAHKFLDRISSSVQDDHYTWDYLTGNMTNRSDGIINLSESFDYDNLDRLANIHMNGTIVKATTYDDNGNITSKTDAGNYTYDPVKLNAVVQIIQPACSSAIHMDEQNIIYTAFKKIAHIREGNNDLKYLYGPDMERRKMVLSDTNGHVLKTRIYCGLYEKETDINNISRELCYIAGGKGATAVLINSGLYYLRRDHQGSITGLIDETGQVVESYSYDAWGKRRNPQTWDYQNVPIPQYLYRGYTFHEMMDEFGLINMNGRAYDPVVGRFLNPDPVIQDGNFTQSYNKYSYCLNNPLKYSDPSGYRFVPTPMAEWRAQTMGYNWYYAAYMWKHRFENTPEANADRSATMEALGISGGNGLEGTTVCNTIDNKLGFIWNFTAAPEQPRMLDLSTCTPSEFADKWIEVYTWEKYFDFGNGEFEMQKYFDFSKLPLYMQNKYVINNGIIDDCSEPNCELPTRGTPIDCYIDVSIEPNDICVVGIKSEFEGPLIFVIQDDDPDVKTSDETITYDDTYASRKPGWVACMYEFKTYRGGEQINGVSFTGYNFYKYSQINYLLISNMGGRMINYISSRFIDHYWDLNDPYWWRETN